MKRAVFCKDAIKWLKSYSPIEKASFLGSLPDFSEFPRLSLLQWKEWFSHTSGLILNATDPEGVTIFFQSDIKYHGLWVDKSFLIQQEAERLGHRLIFHKIFCRTPPGSITFGRPSYSHMICFSRTLVPDLSRSTADVIPDLGSKTWVRGMGLHASLMASQFVLKETSTRLLINPFCGEGSVLAAANYVGLDAIGIEKSRRRADKAMKLEVSHDGKAWALSN